MLDSEVTKPRYIFLSHSSTDKPELIRFAEVLVNRPLAKAHNLQVWLDKNNLEHGVQYTNQFAANINCPDTCAFLLFMPRELISAYVEYEIGIALDRHLNDKNAGKRFPILPVYPGARSGRVGLPEAIRTFNYREHVYDDLQQIDAIIVDALGGNVSDSVIGANPAGKSSLVVSKLLEGDIQDGYDVWLSFLLGRDRYILQAEDGQRNITTLVCPELPGTEATSEQLQALSIWLLGDQVSDSVTGRIRIMTDDPLLAMLPWQRLPHPYTGKPLLDSGWIIEIGKGCSYTPGFVSVSSHTPLLVIPSHYQHEIAGDQHYSLIQSFLEAYLAINSLIPRVTNPTALKRELRFHQPDFIYIYARFNGSEIELDNGLDGNNCISLEMFGLWVESLEKPPVVILHLIGESLKYYPSTLVKASRLLWIQATSRTKKRSGDLGEYLEKVLVGCSPKNGDLCGLILQQTACRYRGLQSFLWVNGQTPWLDIGDYKNKYVRRLRAALLKVMLGRESLKHHMAGVVYTHLTQSILLSAYIVTGDKNACPHDVPAQIQYRLQWGDRERSIPVIQFYFHVNVESMDYESIEDILDMAITQGILYRTDDVEQVLNRELERRGLQQQECCVALNWLLRVDEGEEKAIPEWLSRLGELVCEYFSKVRLEKIILLNAICIQVQDEITAQEVQLLGNNSLRRFRNINNCYIEPVIIRDALGKLDAYEVSDFLDANQNYWHGELKMKVNDINSWDFANWIVSQTNGLFEDTVNLIWKQYQCNYVGYVLK